MKAEIICIGTELLLGHIVNTNTSFLSQKLAEAGIDVYHHTAVGDNVVRLTKAIRQAMVRSDIVITSGGLGPTVDDITAQTVTTITGKKAIRWVKNNVGSAPGMIAKYQDKVIICLPGPPREITPMFLSDIIPYLKRIAGTGWVIKSRTIKTTGLVESKVNRMAKDILNLKPPTTVGIYAKLGEVSLKIMSKAESDKKANTAISKVEKKIRARLKDYIFGYDDETLEGAIGKQLTAKKKTIAIAESCTGGLVSHRITNVSGSSRYFKMAVVAYSNGIKEDVLGVSRKLLTKYGAVSRKVALEMAKGMKYLASSDIALAITGIAGPTGTTRSKPVGLVYVALVTDKKRIAKELRFKGSREEIKFQASQAALDLIRRNA